MHKLKETIQKVKNRVGILIIIGVVIGVIIAIASFIVMSIDFVTGLLYLAIAGIELFLSLILPTSVRDLADVCETLINAEKGNNSAGVEQPVTVDYSKVFANQETTASKAIEFESAWVVSKINSMFPCETELRMQRKKYICQILNGVVKCFISVKEPELTSDMEKIFKEICAQHQQEIGVKMSTQFTKALKIIIYEISK